MVESRYKRFLAVFLLGLFVTPSFIPVSPVQADSPSGRWVSENTFETYLGWGKTRAEVYSGSMAYFDAATQSYQPIDVSLWSNSTHYLAVKGIYHVYFAKSLSVAWPFTIERNGSVFQWRPNVTGYVQVGTYQMRALRGLNTSASIVVIGNTITYRQIFGRGVDLRFTVGTDTLKEELLVSAGVVAALPSPSVYGMNPGETFVGMVSRINTGLTMTENGNEITDNFWSDGRINLKKNGVFKLGFVPSAAWDSQNDTVGLPSNMVRVRNILVKSGGWSIGSGVPYSWIKGTVGNVVIDPTTTVQPSDKDTMLNEGSATTNYGALTRFDVRSCAPNCDIRSILDFTWSISAGSIINSAVMSVYYYNHGANDPVGRTYRVNPITGVGAAGWVEAQATWNVYSTGNSWTTAGGDYSPTNSATDTVPAAYGWMDWTVTALIADYVANGSSTANLLIKDDTEGSATDYQSQFYSREGTPGDTSLRPKLVIEYTPLSGLNLHVYAANGSTLCTSLTSRCYTVLTNSSGSFKQAVSSGWSNYTGLTANQYNNITLQAYNTTNSNSFILVNSSNSVSINVTATMNRALIGSIYQSVTFDFDKDDGNSFTPSSFNYTFGNNGTVMTGTSAGVFVNGSNTIHRMGWQGNNVKNTTTTFAVTSNAQGLVFEGRIYVITFNPRDTSLANIGSGMQFNITMGNTGNTTALAMTSVGSTYTPYLQNGSITILAWWRGVWVGNSTAYSYTVSATATVNLNVNVGNDTAKKTRFAEGTDEKGTHSMMIEGISAEYQSEPSSVLVNDTAPAYTNLDVEWNFTNSLNLLNLTLTGQLSSTNLIGISINTVTMQVTFNATTSGSSTGGTKYVVAWGGVACGAGSTSRTIQLKDETNGLTFDAGGYYAVNITAQYDSYVVFIGENSTSFTVCDEPLIIANVRYVSGGSSNTYYRTLIPSALVQNMYIPDIRKVSIALYTVTVQDLGKQYAGATVRIYQSSQEVVSRYLDAGYRAEMYLVEGTYSTISVIGASSTYSTGSINADPASTTITITIGGVSLISPNDIKTNIVVWTAQWVGANLQVQYVDANNQTSSAHLTIYRLNSTGYFNQIYDNTYNYQNFTVVQAGNTSLNYYAKLAVVNSQFGSFTETKPFVVQYMGVTFPAISTNVLGLNDIFPVSGGWVYLLNAGLIIAFALIWNSEFGGKGAIFISVLGLFLGVIGWLPLTVSYAMVALVIAVLAHMTRRPGDTGAE